MGENESNPSGFEYMPESQSQSQSEYQAEAEAKQPPTKKRYCEPARGTSHSSFVKLGQLHLLVTTENKVHLKTIADEEERLKEFFRSAVHYIVRDKPKDRVTADPLQAAQHFQASLDIMQHIYSTKPQSFEEYFHHGCPRELIKGVTSAASYYGIFFDGCREDKGGKWLLYLFAVVSVVYMTRAGRNRYWNTEDLEPYFVPMFESYEKVGMFKRHANEFFVLTSAANWMTHFLSAKMITDAVSKTRQFQLLEMLIERRKLVSGGDATPHYCRLLIMYYSIYQYFFTKPPQGTRQVHKANSRLRDSKRLDMSTIPKIPDAIMRKMKNPLDSPGCVLELGDNEPQDIFVAKPRKTVSVSSRHTGLSPLSEISRSSSLPATSGSSAGMDIADSEAALSLLGVMYAAAADFAEAKTEKDIESSGLMDPTAVADTVVTVISSPKRDTHISAISPTSSSASSPVKVESSAPAPAHGSAPEFTGLSAAVKCHHCQTEVDGSGSGSSLCPDCWQSYCPEHVQIEDGKVRRCARCAFKRECERQAKRHKAVSDARDGARIAMGAQPTPFDAFVREHRTSVELELGGSGMTDIELESELGRRWQEMQPSARQRFVDMCTRNAVPSSEGICRGTSTDSNDGGSSSSCKVGASINSVVDVFIYAGSQPEAALSPAALPTTTSPLPATTSPLPESQLQLQPVVSPVSEPIAVHRAVVAEAELIRCKAICEQLMSDNTTLRSENATLRAKIETLEAGAADIKQ